MTPVPPDPPDPPDPPQPPPFDHTANRLGALAVRLSDQLSAAVAPRSPSQAAALAALRSFLTEPSVDRLGHVLGLTHSGAVRLVDALVEEGLVSRNRSTGDRRTSVLEMTAAGRRAADGIATRREDVLTGALANLTDEERQQFSRLLDRILVGSVRSGGTGRGWMCRLCDTAVCGADARGQPCPITRAAFEPGSSAPTPPVRIG